MLTEIVNLPDTLDEVECEIKVLESRLVALKRKRNSFLPLCRLPTDVLVEILQQVRLAVDSSTTAHTEKRHHDSDFQIVSELHDFHCNRAWLRMTYVCFYIREVAFAAPGLWTFIDVSSSEHSVALHILRASTLPLIMDFEHAQYARGFAAHQYTSQATAIRFVFEPGNRNLHELFNYQRLSSSNSKPNHTVKTLHVSRVRGTSAQYALSRVGSGLQELYMCYCYLNGLFNIQAHLDDEPRWERMRRLHLENNVVGIRVIQALLSRMSMLESLAIIDSPDNRTYRVNIDSDMSMDTEGTFKSSPTRTLIYLRHVKIHTHIQTTLALLQYIEWQSGRIGPDVIEEGIRGVRGAQAISQITHLDIRPILALESPVTDGHVAPLAKHLIDTWPRVWDPVVAVVSASIVWNPLETVQCTAAELIAVITAVPNLTFAPIRGSTSASPATESVLHIPYTSSRPVLRQHGITFSALDIHTKCLCPRKLECRSVIVAENAPHLTSIIFHGLPQMKIELAHVWLATLTLTAAVSVDFQNCESSDSDNGVDVIKQDDHLVCAYPDSDNDYSMFD
jgi:hypothetical protein